MPTVSLPERPNLAQLKRQARELQRAVRAGDPSAIERAREHDPRVDAAPGYPLSAAQLVLARYYGFASWTRLTAHVEPLTRYTRAPDTVPALADPVDEFLRLACLTYGDDDPGRRAQARALLQERPDIARANVFTAAVVADADHVAQLLVGAPALARHSGGPYDWEPLFWLAYARHDPDIDGAAVVATARVLLEHGADPNAGYFWHGLPTPFTVLTGLFGGGEQGPVRQPRHPHAERLARVVLEAGANPNDGQSLYNRMFEPDDDHLVLLFEHGLGMGDGGPWRARLGDALDAPSAMLRGQLRWAIVHDLRARVELLADHGVDLRTAFADGTTPRELAARSGHGELVAFLDARGGPPRDVDPVDAFVGAALAADRDTVARLRTEHPDVLAAARAMRPALLVWAAALGRPASVELIVELGFDVNARGRGDLPVEQEWETALHQAVANDDQALAERLLALGADPNVQDARFSSTPLGWAHHLDRPALVALLEPITTQAGA